MEKAKSKVITIEEENEKLIDKRETELLKKIKYTRKTFLILNYYSNINEVINEPGIGICIDANQLEKLSQAMIDFISKKQVLESKSSTLFHPTRLKKQINSIYDELLIHN